MSILPNQKSNGNIMQHGKRDPCPITCDLPELLSATLYLCAGGGGGGRGKRGEGEGKRFYLSSLCFLKHCYGWDYEKSVHKMLHLF